MASGIKGFKSQKILKKKISGYTEEQSVDIERYVTVQEITGDRYALDVLIHGSYETGAVFTVEAGSNIRVIKVTGHGAKKGDFVKFVANGIDVPILSVPDANTVILGSELDFDPTGLSIHFLRSVTPSYNPDGSLNVVATTGPIQFRKDGTVVEVMTNSVTPANSVPLPVEIRGASGPINVTAGDINVQLSDKGASPDITRIGDGVNELKMNASGEAKVHDADALAQLTTIAGKDFATQTTLAAVLSALGTLNGKDFSTQTTLAALLAELQLKAKLSDTQPVNEADRTATGSITTQNLDTTGTATAGSAVEIDCDGKNTVAIQLDGTFTGTFAVAFTLNGTTWVQNSDKIIRQEKDSSFVLTITAPGVFAIPCAGLKKVRVHAISAVTGTASATLIASKGGKIANDGVADVLLAAINSQLPAARGQTTMASSMSVTIASNQSAVPVSGPLTDAQLRASAVPVSLTSAPLPTGASTEAKQDAQAVLIGAVNEAAPATDTGSSGLNGRLQRIAQNITTFIGKLPSALGQTTKAGSLSVVLASDNDPVTVKGKALTNSYAEITNLTTTAQTFTAPANAIGGKIMTNQDVNAVAVRYKQNGTATVSSGMRLEAGRSEDFTGGSDISVIAESGTNQHVYIQWTIQA